MTQVGTRLGIPAREVPATVDVVSQETMREQGYRTTAEAAAGAPGVLAVDVAGAPANFQVRGFSFVYRIEDVAALGHNRLLTCS